MKHLKNNCERVWAAETRANMNLWLGSLIEMLQLDDGERYSCSSPSIGRRLLLTGKSAERLTGQNDSGALGGSHQDTLLSLLLILARIPGSFRGNITTKTTLVSERNCCENCLCWKRSIIRRCSCSSDTGMFSKAEVSSAEVTALSLTHT